MTVAAIVMPISESVSVESLAQSRGCPACTRLQAGDGQRAPTAGTATPFGTSGDTLRNMALRRDIPHDALTTVAGSRSSGPSQHGDLGKVRGRAEALIDQ